MLEYTCIFRDSSKISLNTNTDVLIASIQSLCSDNNYMFTLYESPETKHT